MDRPVLFNGRLSKDKIDTWLNLLIENSESCSMDRSLAKAFLQLPESITFVSSIEDNIVGGTSIYRDRTRLSMVLTSVGVIEKFREAATYQIIKSSLPFFKTVAIRDVDALFPLDNKKKSLAFPFSLELDSWVEDVIKRLGFSLEGFLNHYSFKIHNNGGERSLGWIKEHNMNQVSELIWEQSKPMGLTNSLVWVSRDFAASRKCLMIALHEERVVAVAGFWKLPDKLCVSPILINPTLVSWKLVAESLVSEAQRNGLKFIELPLIGDGQGDLISELEDHCSTSAHRRLSLYRKPL
ncbi:MAG: hypothetical protein ACFFDQ_05475 [Candidatus Thorarchaeota archaeon]